MLRLSRTKVNSLAIMLTVMVIAGMHYLKGPSHNSGPRSANVHQVSEQRDSTIATVEVTPSQQMDRAVALCQYQSPAQCPHCGSLSGCTCQSYQAAGIAEATEEYLPSRYLQGVQEGSGRRPNRAPTWRDSECVPWETFSYGEYVGPYRTPHVPVYRLRVGDQISFNYLLTRTRTSGPYRIGVGDILQMTSSGDPTIDRNNIQVLSDGSISLPLVGTVDAEGLTVAQLAERLNQLYTGREFIKDPSITIQVITGDIVIKDLRDAVDARAGQGGQNAQVEVMPDGTVRLPLIGAVPAVGMSLDEIAAEVNARYALHVHGIFVTPNLVRRAPSVIFVLGQVNRPGRQELSGPTSLLQALATAENWQNGANLRQVIVFRRDQNWRLVATKLDIAGAVYGRNPHPTDEIWLRHGDIVLVPPTPILRLSQAVDLYFRRTVYAIFPQQQLVFSFDTFQTF